MHFRKVINSTLTNFCCQDFSRLPPSGMPFPSIPRYPAPNRVQYYTTVNSSPATDNFDSSSRPSLRHRRRSPAHNKTAPRVRGGELKKIREKRLRTYLQSPVRLPDMVRFDSDFAPFATGQLDATLPAPFYGYYLLISRSTVSREISMAAHGMVICLRSSTSGRTSPIWPRLIPAATTLPQRPGVKSGCSAGSSL